MPNSSKPPVYLLDAMSFIFRAYHAMQRSRPMFTRSGLPTAATYVFVNMIRKLRQDFSPQYFAAVFDVSGKVFRDDRAKDIGTLRKWNSKTQCFEEVGYEGYKAKREAMPEDLRRQIPYIRRALEVFRIPILEMEGFEADDVIGTLSCRASEHGHEVYIVSGDKDMMQLVNQHVKVLNPQKDNLILDAAKVEEVLGVPPEKVIDVMALRGDTIDNIPGAPGIGDKGSVDLIKEFGSVEAVLDRAEEVKRKTYRESLQQNRDAVLLSKELVTIDCNVPVELDLHAMETQDPDLEACRELFTELEFTSLLKELAPAPDAVQFELIDSPTAGHAAQFYAAAHANGFDFAIDAAQPAPAEAVKRKTYRESLQQNRDAVLLSKELVTIDCNVPVELDLHAMETQDPDLEACRELFTELEFTSLLKELAPAPDAVQFELIDSPTADQAAQFYAAAHANGFAFAIDAAQPAPAEAEEEEQPQTLSLLDLAEAAEKKSAISIGVSAEPGIGLALALTPELRALLEDESIPKRVHDWKASLHALREHGIGLRGAVDDTMLLSYALNPTHSTQSIADVAARHGHAPPASLSSAAVIVNSLVPELRKHAEDCRVTSVYTDIDLPLAPVLYRMECAGVRIDRKVLSTLSTRFAGEIDRVGERIFELAGQRFNINSPKQLGVVLFTHLGLPAPVKYGKGKTISTAQDVLESLAEKHDVPRLVLEYRHLSKLKSTYIDQLPLMADADSRVHTTFQSAATATGRLSSINPNLQNIPIKTELGREIRAAFTSSPGTQLLSADYSQIELRLLAHFSEDPLLLRAYQNDEDIHTLTASEVFGVPAESMDKETRARAKAVNFGIVYGISPFGLAAQLGIPQHEAKDYIERYFARYRGVQAFIEKTLADTRREGSVRTLFGRVRPIPDIESRNPNQRGFAERTAVNTPLQGTAADLIKLAMIALDRKLTERKLKTRMVLQVHDELLFEVPDDEKDEIEKLVHAEMEGVVQLKVPLVADLGFGPNWRDL